MQVSSKRLSDPEKVTEYAMTKYKAETTNEKWYLIVGLFVGVFLFASCSSGNSSQGLDVYPKAVGAADEASAIQSLRTVATAEAQLKVTRGVYGNFEALTQAGLLDDRFAGTSPTLKGYRFTMDVTDSKFAINADPQTNDKQPTTGFRHFMLDSSDNTIHVNATQPASKSDPALASGS